MKPTKNTIYFLLIFSLFANTCSQKKIIDKDTFSLILYDLHKINAFMGNRGMTDKQFVDNDTVSYYNFVFKKYDISKADFENTVDYYVKHPKEFTKIYEEVEKMFVDTLSRFSEETRMVTMPDDAELWNKKIYWEIPQDGKTQAIPFRIPVRKKGTYKLTADILMYPDDETVNPRITLMAYYTDGSYDYNTNGTMVKDGKWHTYSVILSTDPAKDIDYLKGWILDHSSGTKSKHSKVRNISLKFVPED